MVVFLAVKFRAFGVTFGHYRWRATENGPTEVEESDLPIRQPILNFRGIRLWIVSE